MLRILRATSHFCTVAPRRPRAALTAQSGRAANTSAPTRCPPSQPNFGSARRPVGGGQPARVLSLSDDGGLRRRRTAGPPPDKSVSSTKITQPPCTQPFWKVRTAALCWCWCSAPPSSRPSQPAKARSSSLVLWGPPSPPPKKQLGRDAQTLSPSPKIHSSSCPPLLPRLCPLRSRSRPAAAAVSHRPSSAGLFDVSLAVATLSFAIA